MIIPRLVTDDVPGLVEFLRLAFDARGELEAERPTTLAIGDAVVMVSATGPRPVTAAFNYLYVPDADACWRRALAAGARSLEAPFDTPYGERRGMVEDPFGNVWQIATAPAARELPGDAYHAGSHPPYDGPLGVAVNKEAARMARVCYDPAHLNLEEAGDRRGHGCDHATWVFSEESGKSEGLLESGIELVIDARLDPGAAVGLHAHLRTEEIYYMLAGRLTMTTVDANGGESAATLAPGDAHLVRRGQSHFGVAGPAGARFLVVAARVPTARSVSR